MSIDDYLVFDLETQRTAEAVGGWNNIADMKMSVGVIWDSAAHDFFVYEEAQCEAMIAHLLSGKTVVGFNHVGFDYRVVSGYRSLGEERGVLLEQLSQPETNLDLLLHLQSVLGHRIKLDSVARATLESAKSADGLLALQWYEEYQKTQDRAKLQNIIDYCIQDVEVTKNVYCYGCEHGYVYYESRQGIKKVAVNWHTPATSSEVEVSSEQLSLF